VGRKGSAYELVRARLQRRRWPLYQNTKHKREIGPGARLAFYVGGFRSHRGEIVATAEVAERTSWKWGSPRADPDEYLSEVPDVVISLKNVEALDPPISFKQRLPKLSICPKNMQRWGVVVIGGCRGVSARDWKLLLQ